MDSGAKTLIGFGVAAVAASAVAYAVVAATGKKPKPLSDFERALAEKADAAMSWADYDGHCTGYVGSIFRSLGVKVSGTVGYIANKAKQLGAFHTNKIPRVGDMIFFDNTWDANGNGLFDDPMTHIAIVMSVDPDGTITYGHGGTSLGRTIGVMNLLRPDVTVDENGKTLNKYLRGKKANDPAGTKYLSGQLWSGFATVRPEDAPKWA